MIPMASSAAGEILLHSKKQVGKKKQNTRRPFNAEFCVGRAGNHTRSKLFCLAAAENHMLAYHKETLYHSVNIGAALIVNRIISI